MFVDTCISKAMGLTAKEYRKLLTKLRNHLNILEMLMATQRFDEIDFSKVPSVAMLKMKHAFSRDHNSKKLESDARKKLKLAYADYLLKLVKGETKINVKGIQPHEIIEQYKKCSEINDLFESQWTTIKNRVLETGAFKDVTAIVDVSGSMHGTRWKWQLHLEYWFQSVQLDVMEEKSSHFMKIHPGYLYMNHHYLIKLTQ